MYLFCSFLIGGIMTDHSDEYFAILTYRLYIISYFRYAEEEM